MSTPHPLPPKKEVALALLERSNDRGIFVHLDPRQATVVVPPWFKKQPQLVLQIGLNMPVPIPDLRLDDEGMSCTLSFNRSPFYCVVPWASVFAMVGEDGRGMVWPDDVPAEVPLSRQGQQPAPAQATPMRAVEGRQGRGDEGEAPAQASGAGGRARRRPGRQEAQGPSGHPRGTRPGRLAEPGRVPGAGAQARSRTARRSGGVQGQEARASAVSPHR
jgi:hypothetical protein